MEYETYTGLSPALQFPLLAYQLIKFLYVKNKPVFDSDYPSKIVASNSRELFAKVVGFCRNVILILINSAIL